MRFIMCLVLAATLCGAPASAQSFGDFLRKLDDTLSGKDERALPAPEPGDQSGAGDPTWRDPDAPTTAPARPAYSRADVAETQRLLNELGYDAGPVDGAMGRRTRAAIRDFERDQGLAESGRPGPELVAKLRETALSGGADAAGGAPQPKPSFDCALALSDAEKAICRSRRLAALDRAMAEAFQEERSAAPDVEAQAMMAEQRAWLGDREACGADAACLESALSDRLAALGGEPADVIAESDAIASAAPAARLTDGSLYGFALGQYLAAHPADAEADGFLAGYANYRCGVDRSVAEAARAAARDEFENRDFMNRMRGELQRDVAAAAPRAGRYVATLRVGLSDYDFDGERFRFERGAQTPQISSRGGCGNRSAIGAPQNFPQSFLLVDGAGRPLSGQSLGAMIGGHLPMSSDEARSFVGRYDRSQRSNMVFEATVDLGAPARVSGRSYNSQSAVPATVVSIALIAKGGRGRPDETIRRFGPEEIENPEPRTSGAGEVAPMNAEDLLVHYLKRNPEILEDPGAAAQWAYPATSAGCPAEIEQLRQARARNEFEFRDLVETAKSLAQARLEQTPEPPSRFVISSQVSLGAFNFDRMSYPLTGGGGQGATRVFSIGRTSGNVCAFDSRDRFPSRFGVAVANAGPAYEIPLGSEEAARRFLAEHGLDKQQSKRVTLEFVVELTGYGQGGSGEPRFTARAIEGRVLDAEGLLELTRFDAAIFEAESATGEVAPQIDFETLLTSALQSDPAPLGRADFAVSWAYRPLNGVCPPEAQAIREARQTNEFRYRELVAAGRDAAAKALAAAPQTPARVRHVFPVRLGQFDASRGVFPVEGGFRGDAGRPSTAIFRFNDRRGTCIQGGGRYQAQFELSAVSASPPNTLAFSADAARAFLTDNGLDQANRQLLQEVELELVSTSLADPRSGRGEARVLSSRLLSGDGAREVFAFDAGLFDAEAERSVWAAHPPLSYRPLFLSYVGARPELVADDSIVRAYLDLDGCQWRKAVRGNEIQARARVAEGRERLRSEAAAAGAPGPRLIRVSRTVEAYQFADERFPYANADDWRVRVDPAHRCDSNRGAAPERFEIVLDNMRPLAETGLPMEMAAADAFLTNNRSRQVVVEIPAEVATPTESATARASAIAARTLDRQAESVLHTYEGFEAGGGGPDLFAADIAGVRLGQPASLAAQAASEEVAKVAYTAHFGAGSGASGPSAALRRWSLHVLENGERLAVYRAEEALDSEIFAIVRTIRLPTALGDLSVVGGRLQQSYGEPTTSSAASSGPVWTWRNVTTPASCAPQVEYGARHGGELTEEVGDAAVVAAAPEGASPSAALTGLKRGAATLSPRTVRLLEQSCAPVLQASAQISGGETLIVVVLSHLDALRAAAAGATETPEAAPEPEAPNALEGVKF